MGVKVSDVYGIVLDAVDREGFAMNLLNSALDIKNGFNASFNVLDGGRSDNMRVDFEGVLPSKIASAMQLTVTISEGAKSEAYRTSVGEGGETIEQVLDYVFGRVKGKVEIKPGVGNVPGTVVAEKTTHAKPGAGVVKD